MALFTVVVLVQVFSPRAHRLRPWAASSRQWMKLLTFAVIIALLWHAWVGMRDIWMDYIKPDGPAPGAAGFHHRLARRLRRLGHPGSGVCAPRLKNKKP